MTLQQFIDKWNGKPVDFDKALGPQCMDLMHQYVTEVLGLTDPNVLRAAQAKFVYQSYPNIVGSQYFDRIANTPTGVPKPGDIMFWTEPFGKFVENNTIKYAGHVAVFISGNVNSFVSFDQNFNHPYCEKTTHNYNGVLGWLHFKQTPEKMVSANQINAILNGPGSDGDKINLIKKYING